MAVIPIIVPVNHMAASTLHEVGWVMLGVLAFSVWFGLWMWIGEKFDYRYSAAIVFGGGFGIPLLVGGLCLILLT